MTKKDVETELKEMRRLGMNVPAGAFKVCDQEGEGFLDGGMRVSEIADLCVELATITGGN
jgi:hypothetical protein